jgi:hypothetical protein
METHPFEEVRFVTGEMEFRKAERLEILLNGEEREPTAEEIALANADSWEWLRRYNSRNIL